MHYRLFVTMNASSKDEAIKRFKDWMEPQQEYYVENPDDPDDGEIHGIWDWYVIGGRWSGDLLKAYDWYKQWEENRKAIFEQERVEGWYIAAPPGTMAKQNAVSAQLKALWQELAPAPYHQNPHPFSRDSYEENGLAGDVLPVDAEILAFLRDDNWHPVPDKWGDIHAVDLEGETPDESFIGRKWIVVADYHT